MSFFGKSSSKPRWKNPKGRKKYEKKQEKIYAKALKKRGR